VAFVMQIWFNIKNVIFISTVNQQLGICLTRWDDFEYWKVRKSIIVFLPRSLFQITRTSISPVSKVLCRPVWVVGRPLAVPRVVRVHANVTFARLTETLDALFVLERKTVFKTQHFIILSQVMPTLFSYHKIK
jgi:hypothetical protein